ncbi:MAG: YdcF family protein [Alkalimonas sp.]|nr:YdcF family protein [Alkalimonas sp.]
MTDFIQLVLYPHNLFLYALLLAAICYRKKGLWLLWLLFYLLGNSFVTNQVRDWQLQLLQNGQLRSNSTLVVLGCGGSPEQLPACARNRLDHLLQLTAAEPMPVVITTRHCGPYLAYLQQQGFAGVMECFDGGANTYQEFYQLSARFHQQQPLLLISSDHHGWRVQRLIALHQLNAEFSAATTSSYRPLPCRWQCWLTVNLSNYDFFAKLSGEWFSYASYRLSRGWYSWQQETEKASEQ